jgi:LysR family glycine cleavage system transcriptional activator
MKRGRIPLTALRSFEAAGRHESFTQASKELFVSQAAISRQVRDLEKILGKPLFARAHRQVTLTAAGEKLLDTLSHSFDAIEACIKELADEETTLLLTVNSEPAFAFSWLVPQLKGFRNEYSGIDVSVESDNRIIDFKFHHAEIAIRFSLQESSWPNTESRFLLDSEVYPVMSPRIIPSGDRITNPADLLDYTLLHEWNRDDWKQWFAISGITSDAVERGPIFDDGPLVLQAALDGQGVAILEKRFVTDHVDAGHLIQPFNIPIRQGAYWIVFPDFKGLSKSAKQFIEWVQVSV